MHKIHLRLSQKITFSVFAFLLLVQIILSFYERQTRTEFYFAGIRSDSVHAVLLLFISVAAMIFLLVSARSTAVKLGVALLIALVVCWFCSIFFTVTPAGFYRLTSPDGSRQLFAEEKPILHNCELRVYTVEAPFFIRRAAAKGYANFVHPFRDGEAVVEWQDDRAVVYLFGENSPADDIVTVYFDE